MPEQFLPEQLLLEVLCPPGLRFPQLREKWLWEHPSVTAHFEKSRFLPDSLPVSLPRWSASIQGIGEAAPRLPLWMSRVEEVFPRLLSPSPMMELEAGDFPSLRQGLPWHS
jgi:hypothetical protein